MKTMRHMLFAMTAIIAASVMMTACTESADSISSDQITSKVNQQLKDAALADHYSFIQVGSYEVDHTTRCQLKQLEAAGIITYSEQRFCWWEKKIVNKKVTHYITHYGWWDSWEEPVTSYVKATEYDNPDHVIATVALTSKGKKLVVDSIPEPVVKEDPDMKQPEYDPDKYPEGKADCAWNFPEIPNPFLEPVKADTAVVEEKPAEKKAAPTNTTSAPKEKEEKDKTERRDEQQYLAYCKAIANASSERVIVRTYSVRATKARFIQIRDEFGVKKAVANVIVEVKKTTEAGRILNNVVDGMKDSMDVELTYYLDKGWVLKDVDF